MILSLIRQHPRLSLTIAIVLLFGGVVVVGGVFFLSQRVCLAAPAIALPAQ